MRARETGTGATHPPQIKVTTSPGETRAALLIGGALTDYAIHRPNTPNTPGTRLRGRITAQVPAMAGAFVALPNDTEGFLPDSQGAANLPIGTTIAVTVARAAQSGKGPRLAHATPDPGPLAVLAPGPDAIQRLLALCPDAHITIDDPAAAIGLHATIAPHPWPEPLQAQIEALSSPGCPLPNGLQASIHPTPALIAIDIDTAAATAARTPKSTAQRDANRAALPALAHAIRLRNLSGAIVVDLAGMSPKARTALAPHFAAALAPDPLNPRFLGFTALGLAEIRRPRIHPPLHELLQGHQAEALAALRHLVRTAAATPHQPLALHAPPAIAAAIEADPHARADLARRTGRPLILRSDPTLTRWTIEHA